MRASRLKANAAQAVRPGGTFDGIRSRQEGDPEAYRESIPMRDPVYFFRKNSAVIAGSRANGLRDRPCRFVSALSAKASTIHQQFSAVSLLSSLRSSASPRVPEMRRESSG